MKKVFCFSCFLGLFASSALYGQDSTVTVPRNRYIQFDIAAGYLKTDLASVNTSLKSFGYKPLKEDFATVTLSGSVFLNRFLIRSEAGLMLPGRKEQANDKHISFGGFTAGIGIGYAIIQKPGFRLYPFAGINSWVTTLKSEDDSPVTNMNTVVTTPHQSWKMSFSNASLDVGLQAEKLIALKNRKWDCPQNVRLMSIGIRAGYYIGLGQANGKYNGHQPVTDAPSYSMKGPYIKLIIGLGAKMRDLKWKK